MLDGTPPCGSRLVPTSTYSSFCCDMASAPPIMVPRRMNMDVTFTHCAGLDVHKKTVVACCLTPGPHGEKRSETRTFSTMTIDLLALADWLTINAITHVAMESTGEFWKPVYNVLEASVLVWVVNAQHIKTVPGRKTDV